MDLTEDLSARVLLKNILSTDPPRTPFTRSASKAQRTSATNRLGNKDAGAQTPKDILRRSLRNKIRESITRKSLPATKRRTASVVLRKANTPAPVSLLFDDNDTPRHILKNIMQTDPVRSPVVHEKAASEEPQPSSTNSSITSNHPSMDLSDLDLPDITVGNAASTTKGLSRKRQRRSLNVTTFEKHLEGEEPQLSSANSSITSKHPSIELSGLDLPDVTIGNAATTTKGLSRKRPRRSLNVTTFEKGLKAVEEENKEPLDDHSSLSLSSSTSLSLKTPLVDVQTEKRGLQRRVSNRRKITEEEFGAAVNKQQIEGGSSHVEQVLSETTYSDGFTLGLSKLSEPDITTDIVHCSTALYAQPDAVTSNFSIVATQDKPTVMASQLQRQVLEIEQEEQIDAEQSTQENEKSMHLFLTEEGVVAEPEDDVDAAESQKEEGRGTADSRSENAANMSTSEEEEGGAKSKTRLGDDTAESEDEENRVRAQTEEEIAEESQNGDDDDSAVNSQTEEDEDGVDSQPEEDAAASSESEEEEVVPDSQTGEEDGTADSQTEKRDAVDSEARVDEVAPDSQTEEEEEEVVPDSQTEEEEGAADSPTEKQDAVDSEAEEDEDIVEPQSDQVDSAECGLADSPPEEEHDEESEEEGGEQVSGQLEHDLEHISRRAHCSGGGVMAGTEARESFAESGSKAHSALSAHSSVGMGSHESGPPHTGIRHTAKFSTHGQTDGSQTEAEPDADKENSFHLSIEDSGNPAGGSPEEAAAQDPAEEEEEEEEEEWEDEDDGEDSEEVPSKTPAFVRERRKTFQPDPLASPVLKNVQASHKGEGPPASKPKQVRKRTGTAKMEGGLPKSYLMSVFKHFAKTKVAADVYPVLKETMDKFFSRLADDLETYAVHAKRKTIEVEDAELLLKRQGYVNDKVPVEVLIEKFLRLDQRRLLIPIATSGNVVIPKRRRR